MSQIAPLIPVPPDRIRRPSQLRDDLPPRHRDGELYTVWCRRSTGRASAIVRLSLPAARLAYRRAQDDPRALEVQLWHQPTPASADVLLASATPSYW